MTAHRLRATDFYVLTQCDRQVYLDYHGDPARRVPLSRYHTWLIKRGIDFEHRVISTYDVARPAYHAEDLESGFDMTCDLMRQGVELIYQGVLLIGELVGVPDLLERVPGSSRWGDYHYRPIDIKTSSASQPGHRLQVMAYIAMLEAIQGARPEGALLLHIPAEDQEPRRIFQEERVVFDEALFARALAQIRRLAEGYEPRPFISSACGGCGWQGFCKPLAETAQDVSLIPGLKRAVWHGLHARGLSTLDVLAGIPANALLDIKGVGAATAESIVRHARALTRGEVIQIAAPSLPHANQVVFFDVETVPDEEQPGRSVYYLMGTLVRDGEAARFACDLAAHPAEEPRVWDAFLRRIDALPGPVVHYGSYERTAVHKLVERYGGDPRAEALLARMIDLERALRDCAVLPLRGYSLKDVAPWLGFEWTGDTRAGDDSMLEYMAWLEDGNRARLDGILLYNEADCRATAAVYDWLRSLPGDHTSALGD